MLFINRIIEVKNVATNYHENLVAHELVTEGAYVSLCNKYGQTPLEKAQRYLAQELEKRAQDLDQDLTQIPYQDQVWPSGPPRPNTMRVQENVRMNVSFSIIL